MERGDDGERERDRWRKERERKGEQRDRIYFVVVERLRWRTRK